MCVFKKCGRVSHGPVRKKKLMQCVISSDVSSRSRHGDHHQRPKSRCHNANMPFTPLIWAIPESHNTNISFIWATPESHNANVCQWAFPESSLACLRATPPPESTPIVETYFRPKTGMASVHRKCCDNPVLTIDTLPDDVLTEIFAFCVSCPDDDPRHRRHEWQSLVQVCKRWQETIYASPRYLDLSLYLSNGHSITRTLRWPELPLIICYSVYNKLECGDYLYDALTQRDRIRCIHFFMRQSNADWIAEPMEQHFPLLTHLDLKGYPKLGPDDVPYISLDRFLGGSAPSLQHLCVDNFEHEGLPSLLSSAPNLISLQFKNIRLGCYMSPEEMVGALAGLTKLRDLCIEFSTRDCHAFRNLLRLRIHSPSPARVIFAALTKVQIRGDSEYLEYLMALFDAPRLEDLSFEYPKFDRRDEINAGNLSQFINRTATFKHAQFRRVELTLNCCRTYVKFDLPHREFQRARLSLTVSHREYPNASSIVSDMSHVLGQLAIMHSDVRHLSIRGMSSGRATVTRNHIKLGVALAPLFRSFPGVDVLRVSEKMAGHFIFTLKDMPEMVAEALPALQVLWIDGSLKDMLLLSIERFLSLHKKGGRSVVVVTSRKKFVKTLNPQQLELSESP